MPINNVKHSNQHYCLMKRVDDTEEKEKLWILLYQEIRPIHSNQHYCSYCISNTKKTSPQKNVSSEKRHGPKQLVTIFWILILNCWFECLPYTLHIIVVTLHGEIQELKEHNKLSISELYFIRRLPFFCWNDEDTVFVTVGTTEFDHQLITRLDRKEFLSCLHQHDCIKLIVQYGRGAHISNVILDESGTFCIDAECYRYKPTLVEDMKRVDLVISHCGAGSIFVELRSCTRRFLEFFGKCGAVRMLKAGAQSFSSGVGSSCG